VTLGVLHCLLARVGDERYALPVPGIVESISLKDVQVHSLAGRPVVMRHGATVPLLDLANALGLDGRRECRAAVVVRHGDRQVAWAVDRLDGELELVVKDLGPFLGRLPVVSGATIDGDGAVVCLVDLRELGAEAGAAFLPIEPAAPSTESATSPDRPRVLVVEDSVGVRELERVILQGAGFAVITAVDGSDGAAKLLDEEPTDLVLTDVEMPGMDGFALTREIRRAKGWEHVPIIIMTSRGSDEDQRAGLDAGASAYLLKTEFDQDQLVETVRRLVGR
jgi:CheY-like chemotaxis protein/chemotaxis signal transduction protein